MLAAVNGPDCGADELSWMPAFPEGVKNWPTEARCANPVSRSRIASRTAESASPIKCFTLQWRGSLTRGSSAWRPISPHWFQKAGFAQTLVASAQKVTFHGARYHVILLLSVPNSGGKVAHASTDAFVYAWIGRRHDELHCPMVSEKRGCFGDHELYPARR